MNLVRDYVLAWSHCAAHKGHAEGHMMDPFPLPKRINNTQIVGKKNRRHNMHETLQTL